MTRTFCIAAMLFAATIASSCKRNRRSDEVDNADQTYRMPAEMPAETEREPRPRLGSQIPETPVAPAPAPAHTMPQANPTAAAGVTGAGSSGDAGIAPGIPMAPADAGVGADGGMIRDAGGMRDGGTIRDAGDVRGDGGASATGTTSANDTTGAPLVDETSPEPGVEDTTGDTTGNPSGDTTDTSNGETTNPPQQ